MNIKVHEISQVTCVLITYHCQSIRRKPVLTRRKQGKWILCVFILGKLRFDNIQGQILPLHVYATGFCTQERHANSIPYAVFVRRKFTGEQTNSQSFAKGKAIFPRVTLQESIFFCSGMMLPEKQRNRDFCTQPICSQGTETQSQSNFWLSLLISLLFSAAST